MKQKIGLLRLKGALLSDSLCLNRITYIHIMERVILNIVELMNFFEDKINKRLNKRKNTERYLDLIRKQILELKMPHAPVRKIYVNLISSGECDFTYQYFMKIVESNWNTMVDDDNKCYIIVSSETNRLCGW